MIVHLVDGTWELFRQYFAPRPGHLDNDGHEIGATRGVVASMLTLLQDGATHISVATDHIVESFRNDLWPTYKTGENVDPLLRAQFDWLESALRALGLTVWPMVELEADDALATAAVRAAADPRVEQVIICTPDKDLGQCVSTDGKVVQWDRRQDKFIDADGVIAKFGVAPESIPDWLALVGDASDGFPGLPGVGAKSAATLLARYRHLEDIPPKVGDWDVTVRHAAVIAATLVAHQADALTFKRLATLRTDAEVGCVDEWRWTGPTEEFPYWCTRFGMPRLAKDAAKLAAARTSPAAS